MYRIPIFSKHNGALTICHGGHIAVLSPADTWTGLALLFSNFYLILHISHTNTISEAIFSFVLNPGVS